MTLQVRQLVKHFDGVKAVNGVSFDIQAGECVALIGPNGAGKSTCFACIAGQHQLTRGEVLWAGERLDGLTPAQRLAKGVARTFQVAQTFEALTALQNVQLLLQASQGLSIFSRLDAACVEEAMSLLKRVGLDDVAHADTFGLPYGAKKRLELAMALAGIAGQPEIEGHPPRPSLLLLDEPAAGLAGPERAELMALIKRIAHEGTGCGSGGLAVLYTEHNMDAVFGVADRVIVLIDGQIAAQGLPHDIADNERVRTRYLGQVACEVQSQPDAYSQPLPSNKAKLLSVKNLNVWYGAAQALFDVSLQVGRGELVVLQGLNGAGKSTLLQAVMGMSARAVGEISYENTTISSWSSHQRARAGLGYVAEDRRLFTGLTVQENLRVVARGRVQDNEDKVLELFPWLRPMLQRKAGQMSGGEQQMLAIARTLMTEPQCLLLDEPFEGISPVLVETIVQALIQLKSQGMPMLVAEQNKLLASRADRVITLVAGQVSA
jgi:branched-chain amino acid transport system ATP-binding protein